MPLINTRDLTLGFGMPPLLDKVTLQLDEKERICILGRNGMGKSTLLKLLNNEIKPDGGEIVRNQGLVTAKLDQEVPEAMSGTVYDVVAEGLGEQGKLLAAYQHISHQLAQHYEPALLEALEKAQHALDKHQAWNLSPKIDQVLSRLGLNGDDEFSALSGGMKRRVLLGKALVTEPQLLLLDEPTNHLDIESINWLENFLKEFEGTVMFITHDRAFLQALATRILEIDRGKVQSYPGNYAQYVERKAHELEVEATHNQLFDKKLAQEEVWIRQGIKARRTRNEGRAEALKKLREERKARREVMGKVSMQVQQAETSGKMVIEAKNIDYRYDDKPLVSNFSTTILRGDKIGIIGPNGVGKSTVLKILLGELAPQKGTLRQGTKLEIAYFDQLRAQLDLEKTVAENVSYGDQYVEVNGRPVHIIGYLQDFLFSPDRARSLVKSLSGGERNRLLLARLFSKPSNLLVMDEPTNDLDLETLELLEDLLINYEGTLLLVSHDRSFLNNVVTSTLVFEGEGEIKEYVGGYDDWIRQRPTKKAAESPTKIPVEIKPQPAATKPSSEGDFQRQKQVRALEARIEKLEKSQHALQEKLGNPQLYEPAQTEKLASLQKELQQVETELRECVGQWEKLVD